MEDANELYVEVLETDEAGMRFTAIVGLLVFDHGEFETLRTLSDLRTRIAREMEEEIDFDYVFVKDKQVVTPQQEASRAPLSVIRKENVHKGKKTYTEYKVTIRKVVRGSAAAKKPRGNMTSFDARSGFSGARSQVSTSTVDVKDSGFMKKLDIFSGTFQHFYFQVDTTCTLYAFGPCDEGQFEYEFRDVARSEAADSINLMELYRIKPYEGSIPAPRHHFCMELYSESGAKWVLGVSTVAEFAKWIKSFHRASPKLAGVQYNIVHEKYTWSTEKKQKSSGDDSRSTVSSGSRTRRGGNKGAGSEAGAGAPAADMTRIKTFKVITFTDSHFGMQLTSCPDGTMVHSVLRDGMAASKGVAMGDFVVSVNDKSVVGMRWRDVKNEIMRAPRPVRITFGKPSKKKQHASGASKPGSVGSGLALRRRLGPYLYAYKNRVLGVRKKPHGESDALAPGPVSYRSANPQYPDYGNGSKAPGLQQMGPGSPRSPGPPGKMLNSFRRPRTGADGLSGIDLDEFGGEDDRSAARAASRQLSRYRGIQGRLYQAIQESYEREEKVEALLKNLLAEARSGKPDGVAASGAAATLRGGTRGIEGRVVEELQMSMRRPHGDHKQPPLPVPHRMLGGASGPNAGRSPRSLRDEVALSSRLTAGKMNQARAERLQSVMQAGAAGNSAKSKGIGAQRQVAAAPEPQCFLVALFSQCLGVVHRRLHGDREKMEALIALATTGSVENREDALDAILDIASSSKNLDTLVEVGIIPVLINALRETDSSIIIKENSAGVLWNLSDDPEIADVIIEAGAVPLLLDLLRHEADDEKSSDIAKEEAAGALWNLADTMSCKAEVLRHNGVEAVVTALSDSTETTDFTKENLAGVVWNLAYDHDCLDAIMKKRPGVDPISPLARLITKGTVVAQENAAGAIMRISLAPSHRSKIKACPDAIPALVQLLAFGSILSRENACGALHNIAVNDNKTQRLIVEEGAVPPLVRLLQPQFPVGARSRAALCLRTLAQNVDNKAEISQAGSVEQLVKALKEEDSMLQIHIVEALWGLAHENEENKVFIAQSGAIPKLVSILRSGNDTARVRAAGALGTLAENKNNTQAIVRSGALDPLVDMVRSGARESQREAAAALGNLSRGSTMVQKKLMKSLKGGATIGVPKTEREDIVSVRAKLVELEALADADADFLAFYHERYGVDDDE